MMSQVNLLPKVRPMERSVKVQGVHRSLMKPFSSSCFI